MSRWVSCWRASRPVSIEAVEQIAVQQQPVANALPNTQAVRFERFRCRFSWGAKSAPQGEWRRRCAQSAAAPQATRAMTSSLITCPTGSQITQAISAWLAGSACDDLSMWSTRYKVKVRRTRAVSRRSIYAPEPADPSDAVAARALPYSPVRCGSGEPEGVGADRLLAESSEVMIALKRAYDSVSPADGTRFLVERLWPRGIAKADLTVDEWLKDVGPSTELRKWFGHDPSKWVEFRRRYARELDSRPEAWQPIVSAARRGPVTLVYSSHDQQHNNAVALRDYLQARAQRSRAPKRSAAAQRSRRLTR